LLFIAGCIIHFVGCLVNGMINLGPHCSGLLTFLQKGFQPMWGKLHTS
jgi:hypothetical protein